MKCNRLTLALACVMATGIAGVANAQDTSVAFVTHADTLTGFILHYDASGNIVGQQQIAPQAEATTDTFESDTETAATNSGSAMGIDVYDIVGGQNTTSACDDETAGCDDTSAQATVTTTSFLGGIVTVAAQTTSLNAVADATNPDQIDITKAEVDATTVGGTGISVAPGTYPGGTSFAVSGLVSVPIVDTLDNPTILMQPETFTGQLIVAQVLQGLDPATGAADVTFTAEQLVGQVSDGAGGYYQITLGGPLTAPTTGTAPSPSLLGAGYGPAPTVAIQSAPVFKVAL